MTADAEARDAVAQFIIDGIVKGIVGSPYEYADRIISRLKELGWVNLSGWDFSTDDETRAAVASLINPLFGKSDIEPWKGYAKRKDEEALSTADSIIARLAELGYAKGEWLPIESAPRDGTWIQGYWPTMGIGLYPFIVFWDEGWEPAHYSSRDYGEVFPLFWRPLPAPPTTEET